MVFADSEETIKGERDRAAVHARWEAAVRSKNNDNDRRTMLVQQAGQS